VLEQITANNVESSRDLIFLLFLDMPTVMTLLIMLTWVEGRVMPIGAKAMEGTGH
jgi:hypothetical protein